MAKIGICFANGCEEIEGLTVVDLARRAGLDITMISINETRDVTGSHRIPFQADTVIRDVNWDAFDAIVLPGGIPGTPNLQANEIVTDTVKKFAAEGKLVAAICAAPGVLAACGILEGRNATSNPSVRDQMSGTIYHEDRVVRDGNVITSRAMGTAMDFGLAIVAYFTDEATADKLAKNVIAR